MLRSSNQGSEPNDAGQVGAPHGRPTRFLSALVAYFEQKIILRPGRNVMGKTTNSVMKALNELGVDAPDQAVRAWIRANAPDVPEGHVSLALRRLRGSANRKASGTADHLESGLPAQPRLDF
jgi:hypothetical protein